MQYSFDFIFGKMKKLFLLFVVCIFFAEKSNAQFETVKDSVVQLYGIVMTADSLVGIPAVSIAIKGSNRGTISNNQGVFSIVVLKGDVIEFDFPGKSGVRQQRQLRDRQVAHVVRETIKLPGYNVFKYVNGDNKLDSWELHITVIAAGFERSTGYGARRFTKWSWMA